jgi:hypothetical protein
MYVEREIESLFEKILKVYNLVAIVGARQSGKTTLLRKKLEEKSGVYITFDDPDVRELFNEDIKKFEKQYLSNKIAGMDEIQYGKDAGIKLKYLVDKGYKLLVTSSSEIILSKEVLSYLVGRVSILRLYPFSLKEFIRAKKIKSLSDKIKSRTIWEHIIYGGYPKVVLTEEKEMKEIILRDLFETMLLKDISRNFSIEDLNTLEKLTKYLALNVGNIVSYENLTNLFNLSFKTLKKYLDAVEKSYLIKRVTPFYTNKSRELSKRPKIYFMDLGLRNFISKEFEVQGKNFENYVFTELLKLGFLPKYWRTKEKAEVDFIIEKGNELIPIEVKISSEKVSRSLKSFIKIYKPKKAFVIFYKGRKKEKEIENCKVIFTDIFGLNKLLTS